MDESAFLARSLYIQGSYSAAISTVSSFDNPALLLQLYAVRSHLALSQYKEASTLLSKLPQDDLSVQAVSHLTRYLSQGESVLDEMRDLLAQLDGEDAGVVRPVAATVLHLEGENGEALAVLAEGAKHEEQESVALQVQILLSLDQLASARQAYEQAKVWAEDSLVIQLCEAWIGLRTGGAAYQAAFYVFDEIAQLPSANNVAVLNAKACAQATMGNWPEADAALVEATQINADYAHSLANSIAMTLPSGKPANAAESQLQRLQTLAPQHPLLLDLEEKSNLFDDAASKFQAQAA